MPSHRQAIMWTNFNGNITVISVCGKETAEEARRIAIEEATKVGWTPPRWWQWWRWGDTKLPNL